MKDENNRFLKGYMVDHTDDQYFRFSMSCPICAYRWDSTAIAMSDRAVSEGYTGKVYQDERIWALDEAACRAVDSFDRCPICGKPVCRVCIVTYEELTMCRSCLSRLKDRMQKRTGSRE